MDLGVTERKCPKSLYPNCAREKETDQVTTIYDHLRYRSVHLALNTNFAVGNAARLPFSS